MLCKLCRCASLFALLAPFSTEAAELVANNAEVCEVACGFALTEGPAADEADNVYFTSPTAPAATAPASVASAASSPTCATPPAAPDAEVH